MNDQNAFLVKDKRAKIYLSLDFSIKTQHQEVPRVLENFFLDFFRLNSMHVIKIK